MKYAIIKNTPLGTLLDRVKDKVQWKKYGFSVEDVQRFIVQGEDDNGDYTQLVPITDEDKFNSMLPVLEERIKNNSSDNDSIAIIEGSAANIIISEIAAKREIAKIESRAL